MIYLRYSWLTRFAAYVVLAMTTLLFGAIRVDAGVVLATNPTANGNMGTLEFYGPLGSNNPFVLDSQRFGNPGSYFPPTPLPAGYLQGQSISASADSGFLHYTGGPGGSLGNITSDYRGSISTSLTFNNPNSFQMNISSSLSLAASNHLSDTQDVPLQFNVSGGSPLDRTIPGGTPRYSQQSVNAESVTLVKVVGNAATLNLNVTSTALSLINGGDLQGFTDGHIQNRIHVFPYHVLTSDWSPSIDFSNPDILDAINRVYDQTLQNNVSGVPVLDFSQLADHQTGLDGNGNTITTFDIAQARNILWDGTRNRFTFYNYQVNQTIPLSITLPAGYVYAIDASFSTSVDFGNLNTVSYQSGSGTYLDPLDDTTADVEPGQQGPSAAPEPSTLALASLGMVGLLGYVRLRQQRFVAIAR